MPKASTKRHFLFELETTIAFTFLEDEDSEIEDLCELQDWVATSRYVTNRTLIPKSHDFLLNYLMSQPPLMFKQHLRTTYEGFRALVALLEPHPVFHSNSQCPQAAVVYQAAVCLMRFGSYGNGAALQTAQRTFGVGKGTVVLYTTRVSKALCSMRKEWVSWPDTARREEISTVLQTKGFPKCLGFVDGTSLPLHQKPEQNGQAYFDRKHRYSLKLQVVCDNDRRVTGFHFGWPGSTHDATVYKDCDLYKRPNRYFLPGEYILADSAYDQSSTVVPCYRSPAALLLKNAEFNYCLAQSRVRNEHCIGVLKGRWSSLRELRLPLNSGSDLLRIQSWVTTCIVLHNMLAQLGDSWAELFEEETPESELPDNDPRPLLGVSRREEI